MKPKIIETRNYIDYKVTTWVRLSGISDGDLDIAVGMLKAGHLPSELPNDIDCFSETLYETEEYMVPEHNGNYPTCEAYNSEGSIIYQNGKIK